jgi:hypothetical protein
LLNTQLERTWFDLSLFLINFFGYTIQIKMGTTTSHLQIQNFFQRQQYSHYPGIDQVHIIELKGRLYVLLGEFHGYSDDNIDDTIVDSMQTCNVLHRKLLTMLREENIPSTFYVEEWWEHRSLFARLQGGRKTSRCSQLDRLNDLREIAYNEPATSNVKFRVADIRGPFMFILSIFDELLKISNPHDITEEMRLNMHTSLDKTITYLYEIVEMINQQQLSHIDDDLQSTVLFAVFEEFQYSRDEARNSFVTFWDDNTSEEKYQAFKRDVSFFVTLALDVYVSHRMLRNDINENVVIFYGGADHAQNLHHFLKQSNDATVHYSKKVKQHYAGLVL